MRCRCPFCIERTGSRGNRPFGAHVSVDILHGFFKCFRCGASGRVTERVAELLGIDRSKITFSDYNSGGSSKKVDNISMDYTVLSPSRESVNSIILGRYVRYLTGRGIEFDVIDMYGIGVVTSGKHGRYYRGSYVFPTHDDDFNGFVYRLKIGGYRSPGIKRSLGALYDGNQLASGCTSPLYVVEGPLDRLAVYPCKAVATYGKDITDKQLNRIASYDGPVVFALDGDAWVDSSTYAMSLSIFGHKDPRWVKLPSGKDPGNIGLGILDLEQRGI